MNQEPLVTVLIPVYNRPAVVNTIKSIIKQSYHNLEILIIDNASTDNTVDMIHQINDNRIRLFVNEENRGQTYSLNKGLAEASGKYIARIDSDDLAFPERIKKQVAFLEGNPDFVLIGSWVQFISDNDELGMIVKMPTTNEGMRIMQTVSCGMYHPSAMYRRDVIAENNLIYDADIHMAEDYDLWARLMKYGKACNLAEPLVYYRRGNNNDSRHHHDLMGQESTQIRKRICEGLPEKEFDKAAIGREIELEWKQKKNLVECISIYRFYKKYLNDHLDSNSPDYPILKQHFAIKIYSSCFVNNDKWYAGFVRKLYKSLREVKNRRGGKTSL